MYENIGGKLKWMAKTMALVEAILGIMVGIVFFKRRKNIWYHYHNCFAFIIAQADKFVHSFHV